MLIVFSGLINPSSRSLAANRATADFISDQARINRVGDAFSLFFAYGSLSYLIFLGTFLYAVCFIGDFGTKVSA